MRSEIKYSTYAIVVTTLTYVFVLACCIFFKLRDQDQYFLLIALFVFMIILGLVFGAYYINVDADHIILGSILRRKHIRMRDVVSVELFQPTMGEKRLYGGGGFMGYWGLFRDGGIGRYYAFYGRSSDCFLVRMKNGRKYVLGCENPGRMVDYIKSRIV